MEDGTCELETNDDQDTPLTKFVEVYSYVYLYVHILNILLMFNVEFRTCNSFSNVLVYTRRKYFITCSDCILNHRL